MNKKQRKIYTDEFKQEAVRLALESGRPKAQIARDLGISDGLLHSWINKQQQANAKGMTVEEVRAEQAEINQLKRELKFAKQEIEILKKAAAYFAKESL